jgi:hypothetical protein
MRVSAAICPIRARSFRKKMLLVVQPLFYCGSQIRSEADADIVTTRCGLPRRVATSCKTFSTVCPASKELQLPVDA